MNVRHKFCPACGSSNINASICADQFPAILFPIEFEKRLNVATAPLNVMECTACDHIFLTDINLDFNRLIYSDYYYLYPYSSLESMQDTYRKPFERVFNFFADARNSNGETLLEIGCSSPEQLQIFISKGYLCKGISPGANQLDSSFIVDGFYEETHFYTEFDCIVSRFNLEHIVNLDIYLKKVFKELKQEAHLFLQVPNVRAFLSGGMFGVFAHEHPHYFSEQSLSSVLQRAGFSIEHMQADISSPSIIVVAKKLNNSLSNGKILERNIEEIKKIKEVMRSEAGTSFIFYGASLSLSNLLYLDKDITEYEDSLFVVDENPILHGKFMPNTKLEVLPLDSVKDPRNSILFVLLNSVYHPKVVPKIKGFGFKKVFFISENGLKEWIE
jgi:hypothetical protein